jgi:hypothetical protein
MTYIDPTFSVYNSYSQAFAVVIFGLGKFNIKWVLISIVKIWSKTCTSCRSISVFSKNGICLHAGEFFWRIKRFECENFRFEVPCRRIDDRKSLAFIMFHVYY